MIFFACAMTLSSSPRDAVFCLKVSSLCHTLLMSFGKLLHVFCKGFVCDFEITFSFGLLLLTCSIAFLRSVHFLIAILDHVLKLQLDHLIVALQVGLGFPGICK